jgi:3-hydroxyisobutyrate dehydrogenase-like beta-hydroxyacid dehydrogenase
MTESKTRYGFIGLGNMGGPMVRRLAGLGFELAVYDVNEAQVRAVAAPNVTACASAEEVGALAETVFLSLPTPEIVTRAVLGERGLALGKKVRNVIDFSTIGTRAAAHVGATLATQGVTYVDAPVAGGVTGAGTGKLLMMVSCPPEAFERLRETLALFGKAHFVGSEAGQGQTMKLVNNMLSVAALAATSEGMAMGVKAGLDPAVMLDVLNASSGKNSATTDKMPRSVLPGTFDFGFATQLSLKDLRLCLDEAEAAGVPMIVGSAARTMLNITQASYGPDSDFTSMARVVEQWAKVEIRGGKG